MARGSKRASGGSRGGGADVRPVPRFDVATRVLSCDGTSRRLTPAQHAVMIPLLRAASEVVSHETLWQALREDVPTIRISALRTVICELRKTCREVLGEDVIETVYGKGYRLCLNDREVVLTGVSEN